MASKSTKTPLPRKGSAASPTLIPKLSKPTMEASQDSLKSQVKELVEERMAEVITLQTNLIKELFEQNKKDLKESLKELKEEVFEEMASNTQKIKDELSGSIQLVSSKVDELEVKVEDLAKFKQAVGAELEQIKAKPDRNEAQILTLQFKLMETALRLRGYPERREENLKQIISQALADFLQKDVNEIEFQIDRIYRVNSWYARQNRLPRDIVIYFVRRSLRNEILAHSFKNKFEVENYEVKVLKEIPPKMLRGRRDFFFLTKELQSRNLDYRWEIPYGLSVYFQGKRIRIDTESSAKDFLNNVLKVDLPGTSLEDLTQKGATGGVSRSPSPPQPRDQRITRAALKKLEQQEKEKDKELKVRLEKEPNGAMGGAKPKQRKEEVAAQELRQARNGK